MSDAGVIILLCNNLCFSPLKAFRVFFMFFKFRNVTNMYLVVGFKFFYLLGNWSSSTNASVFFNLGTISSLITFCDDVFLLSPETYQVDIGHLCLLIFLSYSPFLCLSLCVLEDVLDCFSHCYIRLQLLLSPSDFFFFKFSNYIFSSFSELFLILHLLSLST